MGIELKKGGSGASLPSITPISQSGLSTKQALVTESPSASHREGKCQLEALVSYKHPVHPDYRRVLGKREESPSLGCNPAS